MPESLLGGASAVAHDSAVADTLVTAAPPSAPAPAQQLHHLHGPAQHARHRGTTRAVGAHTPAHPHAQAVQAAHHRAIYHQHARTRPAKQQHLPPHHSQHHRSAIHLTAQTGQMGMAVGTIVTYTPPSASAPGLATVQVLGAATRLLPDLPITQALPTDLAVLGAQCLVAQLDTLNPHDALILAIYNAPPARLTQAEGVAVAVSTPQTSTPVTFPAPFASAVHSVVVTPQDPAWSAIARNLTRTGFELVLTAAAQVWQVGELSVSVAAGLRLGVQHLPFPGGFLAVQTVLVSSTDGAWTAAVYNLTPAGCDVMVEAAQATASAQSIACTWAACGSVAYAGSVTVDYVASGV